MMRLVGPLSCLRCDWKSSIGSTEQMDAELHAHLDAEHPGWQTESFSEIIPCEAGQHCSHYDDLAADCCHCGFLTWARTKKPYWFNFRGQPSFWYRDELRHAQDAWEAAVAYTKAKEVRGDFF